MDLAKLDLHLLQSSACIDKGEPLPSEVTKMANLTMQYRPHQAGEARNANGRASDLGAFEFGSLSVARTSPPGPKENKGDREGQPLTTSAAGQDDSSRRQAVTQADNRPMIDVFRDSGFQIREKPDGGYLEVELSVVPGEKFLVRSEMRDQIATTASLRGPSAA